MHDNAYAHDLQVLNAYVTPGCYIPRPSQGHPLAWMVLVVLARRISLPAPTLTAGIDRPGLPLPNVAYVCFKCFRRFKYMLQLFHLDVAKVNRGMLHMLHICCKCFQRHVASVCLKMFHLFLDICCNRFLFGCCICCNSML
jgi:hypothetical protein